MAIATTSTPLRRAPDRQRSVADRFARSRSAPEERALVPTAEVLSWFADQRERNQYTVRRIPFTGLRKWGFEPGTGDLTHESGRFFRVEGLSVRTDYGQVPHWSQPIINQPEIGILGILVKEFNGVLHALMQCKMEPGNPGMVQLSPTVQATRSNFTRVHQGAATPYLDFFSDPEPGRVVVDVLQSEQGSWFLGKRNRSMIVETTADVPMRAGFFWLSLAQLFDLMTVDNLINMDSRIVMACMPFGQAQGLDPLDRPDPANARWASIGTPRAGVPLGFRRALRRSLDAGQAALHTEPELLSWLTGRTSMHQRILRSVPLREMPGWVVGDAEIARPDGRHFSVVAVDVRASNREIGSWTQPLVQPSARGLIALVTRQVDGVLHVLLQARVEAGLTGVTELAPTVQCIPRDYADLPADRQPAFLSYVRDLPQDRVRFRTVLSEEGGRFLLAENEYLVVEVDDPHLPVPEDFAWFTVHQLGELLRHSHYLNAQTRSSVACLHALW